jgi:GTP cyclohydrolase I
MTMTFSDKTDPQLGRTVARMLQEKGLEGPYSPSNQVELGQLTSHVEAFITGLGVTIHHSSTVNTPKRVAQMFRDELCAGLNYNNFPAIQMDTRSIEDPDEIILIRNIEVHSLCEHHFVPVIGKAHVGYIPGKGGLMGLSKFNRIVEFFARRPQLQERMTEQVSATLRMILGTENVATIIEADHFCVKYRGIQDPCSDTVTSKMAGVFRTKPEARAEFLSLIKL